MDDGLKQRIIGAFVLLALAVIFVPVFFDRERIEPVDRKTQIPAAPHIETFVIDEPKSELNGLSVEAKRASDMFIPDVAEEVDQQAVLDEKEKTAKLRETKDTKTKELKQSKKKTKQYIAEFDKNGVPKSWVIQVASYKTKERAIKLRDALVEAKYAAYFRQVKTSKGERVRVYVGPKLDKSALEKQQKEIEKQYKISTMLLQFKP